MKIKIEGIVTYCGPGGILVETEGRSEVPLGGKVVLEWQESDSETAPEPKNSEGMILVPGTFDRDRKTQVHVAITNALEAQKEDPNLNPAITDMLIEYAGVKITDFPPTTSDRELDGVDPRTYNPSKGNLARQGAALLKAMRGEATDDDDLPWHPKPKP